ncbi:MAG: LysM peptidoglycan-binding domain-containing protein [Planctomycetes bacterium]|nr:LysM peptidoglycan-binding domain-containing protein [Planctomycetota bacterium]
MRTGTVLCLALGAVLAIAGGFAAAPVSEARADVIIDDPPKSKRVPVETELDWGVLADRVSRAYVVAKGDTLSTIAQRMCGSATRWKAIADANPEAVRGTDTIDAGTTLWLPPMRSFDPPQTAAPGGAAGAAPDANAPKALLPWYDAFWMRQKRRWESTPDSRASPTDAPEKPKLYCVWIVPHGELAAALRRMAGKDARLTLIGSYATLGMSSLVHVDEPTVRMKAVHRITGIDDQLVRTEVKVTRYDAAGKVVEKVLPLEPSEWDRLPVPPAPPSPPSPQDPRAPAPKPDDPKLDLRDVPPSPIDFRWTPALGAAVAVVGALIVVAVMALRRRKSK